MFNVLRWPLTTLPTWFKNILVDWSMWNGLKWQDDENNVDNVTIKINKLL